MGGISGSVVFGVACHRTLLQLFDPFDFPLKAVADIDGERRVLGIENVPFRAAFEGLSVLLEEVLEPVDPAIKLLHLGLMVGLALFDGFEQRLGDALEGVGVKVGAHVEYVSGRAGRDGVIGGGVSRRDRDR